MAQRLAGKVAVVTGGALGICGGRRRSGPRAAGVA
jgi:hypothetical protein